MDGMQTQTWRTLFRMEVERYLAAESGQADGVEPEEMLKVGRLIWRHYLTLVGDKVDPEIERLVAMTPAFRE